MSTSHYSSQPYLAARTQQNRRRHSWRYSVAIWALAFIDILALAGSKDLVEDLILIGLVLVNVYALCRAK